MQLLITFDNYLFFFINRLPHPWFADVVFLAFSYHPFFLWLAIGLLVFVLEKKRHLVVFLELIIALSMAAVLASIVLKPIIARPRPDIDHGQKVVLVAEGPAVFSWNNGYAFPSGHAAVAFAGSFIVARWQKKQKHWFYALAILTAVSRIYLGKHFPLDVIGGAVVGVFSGFITAKYVPGGLKKRICRLSAW